ncbi:MAG: FAD-binding protein [Chloroflexi bacterium]|nr:MAG: FAD-binding protein [Chloroflexota bacterium]
MSTYEADVLIVGAGIAGLMAANALVKDGLSVIVVDKGRGVGGRMATRRIGTGRADHGAQFFTVRHDAFNQFVQEWLEQGLIRQWSTGWSRGSAFPPSQDGYPRYVGANGMTTVPKFLAEGLDVRKGVKVVKVTPALSEVEGAVSHHYLTTDDNGHQYQSKALLMTAPAPQSLAILKAGNVPLNTLDQIALKHIAYDPCIAAMYWLEGSINLPKPGAIQRPDQTFPWIADNQRKGISPEAVLITVHANPEISWELWDADNFIKIAVLQAGLQPFITPETIIKEAQAHRWRYAIPTKLHPNRTLVAKGLPPLAFAGDAFQEPRVEGAALSGLAAANALSKQLHATFHIDQS